MNISNNDFSSVQIHHGDFFPKFQFFYKIISTRIVVSISESHGSAGVNLLGFLRFRWVNNSRAGKCARIDFLKCHVPMSSPNWDDPQTTKTPIWSDSHKNYISHFVFTVSVNISNNDFSFNAKYTTAIFSRSSIFISIDKSIPFLSQNHNSTMS